jgi:hypothetical protein
MLQATEAALADSELNVDPKSSPDDAALEQMIAKQRAVVGELEQAFVAARTRFDAERRRLRTLEGERDRRIAAAEGRLDAEDQERRPKKKRSTTGFDALLGRDGILPDAPFAQFRLVSLQRQEVLLNHTGDAGAQILAFVDKDTGQLLEARSFGEAKALQAEGHTLGRPGVPLQRQAVWYIDSGKSGWLRLDQIFVERRTEDE